MDDNRRLEILEKKDQINALADALTIITASMIIILSAGAAFKKASEGPLTKFDAVQIAVLIVVIAMAFLYIIRF